MYTAGRTEGHVSAVLVVLSELATNALGHDDPPYAVSVKVSERATLVEVTDAGHGRVTTRVPAFAEGGYGLNLVNTLAASWGVKSRPGERGKNVWVVIARDREL